MIPKIFWRLFSFFKRRISSRFFVIALPFTWVLLFFFIPFLLVLKISFSELTVGIPPYLPIMERIGEDVIAFKLNIGNYLYLVWDDLYIRAILNSLGLGALATIACLIIGFPMAYAIARASLKYQTLLLMMVILPFWTSFLIRVYAWIGILSYHGVVNTVLLKLGIIEAPLRLLNTIFSLSIGITYCYLPFMILPIYVSLQKIDPSLLEAAYDLGSRPFRTFWKVTVPLCMPGIISGSLLVFIPSLGEFVIPDLLGGSDTLMIGRVLWNEFFVNRDWPVAGAVAIGMLVFLVFPIVLLQYIQKNVQRDQTGEGGQMNA